MDEIVSEMREGSPGEMNPQIVDVLDNEPVALGSVAWGAMQTMALDPKRLARNRIVSLTRSDPAAYAYDMLRTKVLRSAQDEKWRSLGVTSPTTGCGKTTAVLNLALSLARQRELRVAVVDLDLRRPRIAAILGHDPGVGTEEFLTGRCPIEKYMVRIADNLAIGASPTPTPNPAELLQHVKTAQTLMRLIYMLRADIVIYDLPPMLVSDDCLAFLPAVDRIMLIAGAEESTVAEIDMCERELSEHEKLLGVVLNKCRHKPARYDYY